MEIELIVKPRKVIIWVGMRIDFSRFIIKAVIRVNCWVSWKADPMTSMSSRYSTGLIPRFLRYRLLLVLITEWTPMGRYSVRREVTWTNRFCFFKWSAGISEIDPMVSHWWGNLEVSLLYVVDTGGTKKLPCSSRIIELLVFWKARVSRGRASLFRAERTVDSLVCFSEESVLNSLK